MMAVLISVCVMRVVAVLRVRVGILRTGMHGSMRARDRAGSLLLSPADSLALYRYKYYFSNW